MVRLPPEAGRGFVAAMADVVPEVDRRPADPARPLVCPDARDEQAAGRRAPARPRAPLAARPGRPPRDDCEPVRHGVADLFVAFEPVTGWRRVRVTETRRRRDPGRGP